MSSSVSIRKIAALLALLAVAAIFVLPAFDMPATALRAKALAHLAALVLTAVATAVAGLLPPPAAAGFIAWDDCSSELSLSPDLSLPLLC